MRVLNMNTTRFVAAAFVLLVLASVWSSQCRTYYVWVPPADPHALDNDCVKHSFVGTYPAPREFCRAAEKEQTR
jgi:hypothetical protein